MIRLVEVLAAQVSQEVVVHASGKHAHATAQGANCICRNSTRPDLWQLSSFSKRAAAASLS